MHLEIQIKLLATGNKVETQLTIFEQTPVDPNFFSYNSPEIAVTNTCNYRGTCLLHKKVFDMEIDMEPKPKKLEQTNGSPKINFLPEKSQFHVNSKKKTRSPDLKIQKQPRFLQAKWEGT